MSKKVEEDRYAVRSPLPMNPASVIHYEWPTDVIWIEPEGRIPVEKPPKPER